MNKTSFLNSPKIFVDNKYLRCYLAICLSRQKMGRKKVRGGAYFENHHIWPTKLGGPDIQENKVLLTAREHFIVHDVLSRCLTGNEFHRMEYAVTMFAMECPNHQRKLNARQYERVRIAYSFIARNRVVSEDSKAKMRASHKLRGPVTEATRVKLGDATRKEHRFFMLFDNDYSSHHDFYRFCDEHKIARTSVQPAMNEENGIGVFTSGKNKGKCFSFSDVGIEKMIEARDKSFQEAKQRRYEARIKTWETRSREKKPMKNIVLLSPEGTSYEITSLDQMRETLKSIVHGSITAVKGAHVGHTFIQGKWKGWTKLA